MSSNGVDASMDAIVVIAASAGGLEPLLRIVAALPVACAASVFVVMHIGDNQSVLPDLLNKSSQIHAAFAQDGEIIEPGRIYVAPRDRHMFLEPTSLRLSVGPKVHRTRPAADPLFISAANVFGERVVGIVLSGGGGDGAAGLRTIKERGGLAFVQHPKDAEIPSMPMAAIVAGHPDATLSAGEIARRIGQICAGQ
jgi:two-component system, chemotaxis family, protein-glutamate methylesterase/glutaminase